jgi:hypothetical protein
MASTKVLITVKTYPTLSSKYDELVCTAGFLEDGTWIRIYPIEFRKKSYTEQYKKYDWIELDLVKNTSDFRLQSFRPKDAATEIKILRHLDTTNNWEERKKLCLTKVYNDLSILIAEAKDKNICTSLAVFKPAKILDFTAESVDREWDASKLDRLKQMNLFETAENGTFKVVSKVPYKFKYKFEDINGKESNLMIEDWETCQLYWNCLNKHKGDEAKALADVRKKYFDDFSKTKDLHFFLGTTQLHHYTSHNPFIIIGTFHPKLDLQGKLF